MCRSFPFWVVLHVFLWGAPGHCQTPETGSPDPATWINLLSAIDPESSVAGRWSTSDDGLQVNALPGARLAIPAKFGEEYDFRVRFTRGSGSNSIALIFVHGPGQAAFDIDGWGQHLAGVQLIDGQDMRAHRHRTENVTLQNGREYTAVVEVRRGRVRGLLDGKELWSVQTDGANLRLLPLWRLPSTQTLGLGAWDSETVFHSVEFRNLGGSPSITGAETPVSATRNPNVPLSTPSPPTAMRKVNSLDASGDDIASLSDEFDAPSTLDNWHRVFQVERTGADQIERIDIGRSSRGALTVVPYTSSWYEDYRGILIHKQVTGDFQVTTQIRTSGRSGRGAPRRPYSLAGVMIRTPRDVSPQTWRPGGENYLFLSTGSASQPGQYQFEVKTTRASHSDLQISPGNGPVESIRVVRIGSAFVLLRKDREENWAVHQRYSRPDMPAELQVGMTVYTDWPNVQSLRPEVHNRTVIRNGQPDLIATFDYFRFARPEIPERLRGKNFADVAQVGDAEVVRLFGED
ncbi:MAG: hypothetical protein KDA80_03570 [Planctomycetaceae bacterium]|nr:hypothetical protein [Planctomycetaceae bacterium]